MSPERTASKRRLYSHADIERLLLLRRATLAGHSIGQVAQLPTESLVALVAGEEGAIPRPTSNVRLNSQEGSLRSHLEASINAIERLDAEALEAALARAAVTLSQPALLEQLIVSLLHRVGERWHEGSLRIAQEHLASAVVRGFLGSHREAFNYSDTAPTLVVTTPAGQLHELGALLVAAAAASEGWRATYLGPNLPAEEIAGAAEQNAAKAVALSIVYPADDPRLGYELEKLRRYLRDGVALFVGGRATESYLKILAAIGAVRLASIPSFRAALKALTSREPSP